MAAESFLGWWAGGLAAPLRRLRPPRPLAAARPLAEISDGGIRMLRLRDGELVPQSASVRGPVVARLARSRALVRELVLPEAVGSDLGQLVRQDIERNTPFRATEVRYDYRAIRGARPGTLEVTVALAPSGSVREVVTGVREAGHAVAGLTVEGLEDTTIDLLGGRRSPRTGRWLGAVLALAIAAAGVAWAAYERRAAELERVVSRERELTAELREVTEKGGPALQRVAYRNRIREEKGAVVDRISILAELTRVLDQGTWVRQLQVNRDELVLQLESSDAASALRAIQSSPLFDAAEFVASVTHDAGRGVDRFRVRAQVRHGG